MLLCGVAELPALMCDGMQFVGDGAFTNPSPPLIQRWSTLAQTTPRTNSSCIALTGTASAA